MAKQTIAGQAGGYRRPSNPAAVSGPGALAKRTDGTPAIGSAGGEDYGEAQALKDLQRSAPTQSQSAGGGTPGGGASVPMPSPTPFDAEGDPNTPITSGVGVGAGVGPEALGLDAKTETRNLPPGMVQLILAASQRSGASKAFRTMVRRAIADRK
jgi:hypothetical protein